MAAIDVFLTIGDIAAGVAAVAALTGLYYARQTVREARAERVAAEQARLSRRVEWVGETVEHIDRLAEDDVHTRPVGETWRRGRQLLAPGFVGLDGRLPQTAKLMNCDDPYSARAIAALAREEIGTELGRLAEEQARQPDVNQDTTRWEWSHRVTELAARWHRDGRVEEPQDARGSDHRGGRVPEPFAEPPPQRSGSNGQHGHRRSPHRLRRG